MFEFITPDLAIAIGGMAGLFSKAYALKDKKTTWSRKSSLVNVIFFIPTLWGMWKLNIWATFTTTFISFAIWTGIVVWRSPPEENLVEEAKQSKYIPTNTIIGLLSWQSKN